MYSQFINGNIDRLGNLEQKIKVLIKITKKVGGGGWRNDKVSPTCRPRIALLRLIYVDGKADALRAYLYGGGGPQIGEVTCTCGGSPTYQVNVITFK